MMDSRLNLAVMESHESDLRRQAEAARTHRRWPDDGRPARVERSRPRAALHPTAVLASLLTWR
jgi:hypothetical protein